jgi:hypothetical protein
MKELDKEENAVRLTVGCLSLENHYDYSQLVCEVSSGFNAIVGNLNPVTVLMMCDSRGREVFTR